MQKLNQLRMQVIYNNKNHQTQSFNKHINLRSDSLLTRTMKSLNIKNKAKELIYSYLVIIVTLLLPNSQWYDESRTQTCQLLWIDRDIVLLELFALLVGAV